MAKRWTKTEIRQLKRLVNKRKESKEIARILGKTQSAINKAKTRYGIYKPRVLSPNNPLHLAEIIKFKMAGWTLERIAEAYGCTTSPVSNILIQNSMSGFMRQKPNYTKPFESWGEYEMVKLRRYCKKGYSLDRICTYFPNRSRKAVQIRILQMTRFWFTPEQKEARRLAKEREWQWRVY